MKLAATILVVFALAAPASAQSGSSFLFAGPRGLHVLSQTSIPVRATGQLTVAFHGDSGTGCAAHGLCAYSGLTSWRPVPSGELAVISYRLHGRTGYLASLFLGGGPGGGSVTVAEVRRAANPGQGGSCADASQNDIGGSGLAVHGGNLAFSLTDVTSLGTRCAGPRAPDLAQALPIRRLAIRAVRRGGMTVNFSEARGFAAHGFAGSVQSSVLLRFGHPQSQRSNQPPPGPPLRPTRTRLVSVSLRLTRLSGQVIAKLAGANQPDECAILDSCSATGAVTLTPHPFQATGQMVAYGPARRPYRDFLAALGLSRTGQRRGITVSGGIGWQDRGAITEAFNHQGFDCRDSGRLTAGAIQLAVGNGQLLASYSGQAPGADVFRTHCPGPQAGNADLATGSLPFSALSSRTVTMAFTTGSTATDDGYSIHTVPALVLTLQRGRVTQQILLQPGP